jgi:4-hydroxybenzoate polyprenyltransferase
MNTHNKDKHSLAKVAYMVYRKTRPALGIPVAFTVMYAAAAGLPLNTSIMLAFSLFCIDLFGGLYNDYWDLEEDLRNGRTDKPTTLKLLGRKQLLIISYLIGLLGLSSILLLGYSFAAFGLYYILLLIGYSHPRIRLKGSPEGYAMMSSIYLLFPLSMGLANFKDTHQMLVFAAFFSTQVAYILCQKDSTDMKDESNLFIRSGWDKASFLTLSYAICSSIFLLILCLQKPYLAAIWAFNLVSKILNVSKILTHSITRKIRGRLILAEFLTPYLYAGVIRLV